MPDNNQCRIAIEGYKEKAIVFDIISFDIGPPFNIKHLQANREVLWPW